MTDKSVALNTAPPPILFSTLQNYAKQIFDPIKRGESVTTIWLPMLGRRIVNKYIIKYPEAFKDQLADPEHYLFIYIEPLELTEESAAGYIKLIIKSILESYLNPQNQKELGSFSSLIDSSDTSATNYPHLLENLSELIKQIAAQNLKMVLFLGEFDELSFANQVFYNNLKALWAKSDGSLYFIFLLLTDVSKEESIDRFGELNELILKNIVYVPLLKIDDINYQIDYFSKQLQRPFTEEEKQILVQLCGGHPYLLKLCTRFISLMNDDSSTIKEMLLNHFEPRSVCRKIFKLLSPDEQAILREIVKKRHINQLPPEASTLIKLGLIEKNEIGFWEPFGELFKLIIETDDEAPGPISSPQSSGVVFDEKSGAIFIGNTNIEEKFTRQEYEILSFFLKDPNKLHSREEIGEAMWGKESYEKYSDWAIDQIMSKIRKKLQNFGADKTLVTVRGRGYKLSIN